jgi:hypothetical protein
MKLILSPKLKRFLIQQKWVVGGFLISAVFLIGVSFTFLADAIYFNDPRHQNVQLKAWMTPRYLALSYDLPRPVVMELLGIEKGSGPPGRLDRLSESLGLTLDELTEKAREAKKAYMEKADD